MIECCRAAFPVRLMCRSLQVSASGYYDWRERGPSPRGKANDQLLCHIRRLHADSDGVLGAPRVWEELQYAGIVNRKLKCPLFRILKCPLVDKEIAVSIILCISPYLATVPVSLQAHVPTTLPCASLSTGNSPP